MLTQNSKNVNLNIFNGFEIFFISVFMFFIHFNLVEIKTLIFVNFFCRYLHPIGCLLEFTSQPHNNVNTRATVSPCMASRRTSRAMWMGTVTNCKSVHSLKEDKLSHIGTVEQCSDHLTKFWIIFDLLAKSWTAMLILMILD